jgi:hypothetical protein
MSIRTVGEELADAAASDGNTGSEEDDPARGGRVTRSTIAMAGIRARLREVREDNEMLQRAKADLLEQEGRLAAG